MTTTNTVCQCGHELNIAPGYSHANCGHCNTFWFPTKIETSEDGIVPQNRVTSFYCPRCTIELEVGTIDETEVCFCKSCRGFIVDSESLGLLIRNRRSGYSGPEDTPAFASAEELDVASNCPACSQRMEAYHYCGPGNIVLDTCMTCQVAWMDHGELSKIMRAPGQR